jgi:hypothetical protein
MYARCRCCSLGFGVHQDINQLSAISHKLQEQSSHPEYYTAVQAYTVKMIQRDTKVDTVLSRTKVYKFVSKYECGQCQKVQVNH